MSRELTTWAITEMRANTAITSKVGVDSGGFPAIFPFHYADVDDRVPYPHITVARIGGGGGAENSDHFQAVPELAVSMDRVRMAFCVWSTISLDEAYIIYNLVDKSLRGPGVNMSNQYFSSYRIRRTNLRDDLFDDQSKAYHIHAEYEMTIQLTQVAQP